MSGGWGGGISLRSSPPCQETATLSLHCMMTTILSFLHLSTNARKPPTRQLNRFGIFRCRVGVGGYTLSSQRVISPSLSVNMFVCPVWPQIYLSPRFRDINNNTSTSW